jgi:hypothetical protein
VTFAIKGCSSEEADSRLWMMRICDCKGRVSVGAQRFALKIDVFKARRAVAVRERHSC